VAKKLVEDLQTNSAESVICKKERTLETKLQKKQEKDSILKKLFGFSQKYLFKSDISDSVLVGSL